METAASHKAEELPRVEGARTSGYPHRTASTRRVESFSEGRVQPQNLVLILARELADKLATAMFVVDQQGRLVYFNERAGEILGESFATVGRMDLRDWTEGFQPADLKGRPLAPEKLPLAVALIRREPAHRSLRITGRDRRVREIAATAFPLFARADEFVGAAAIFWELPEATRDGGATR